MKSWEKAKLAYDETRSTSSLPKHDADEGLVNLGRAGYAPA